MKDFENVNARSLDDFDFSPEEFVSLLFDRTDEDGVLYTPSYFVNEESDFRCRVNWSLDKRDALTKKLRRVFGDRLSNTQAPELSICGRMREGRGVRVDESMPVSQSQLLIGMQLPAQIGHPDDAVAVVLCELLGKENVILK